MVQWYSSLTEEASPLPYTFIPTYIWNSCPIFKKNKTKQKLTGGFWILATARLPQTLVSKPSYAGFYELPLQSPPSLSLNMPFFKNDFWRICTF